MTHELFGSTASGFDEWLLQTYGGVKPDYELSGSQLTGGTGAARVRVADGLCHIDGDTTTFHNDAGTITFGSIDATEFALNVPFNPTGNVNVGGNLKVAGNTALTGTLDVAGNTALAGTLDVAGNTALTGTLDVTGNVTGSTANFTGNVTGTTANFTGKLTVGGLIDPTGLVLSEQAAVPGGAPAAGNATIWAGSSAPNRLRFTDDAGTAHQIQDNTYKLRVGSDCTYTTIEGAIAAAVALSPTQTQQCCIYIEPGTYNLAANVVLPAYTHLIATAAGEDTQFVTITAVHGNDMINAPASASDTLLYGIRFAQQTADKLILTHTDQDVKLRALYCSFENTSGASSRLVDVYAEDATIKFESCYFSTINKNTEVAWEGAIDLSGTGGKLYMNQCRVTGTGIVGGGQGFLLTLNGTQQAVFLSNNTFAINTNVGGSSLCIGIVGDDNALIMDGGSYTATSGNNRNATISGDPHAGLAPDIDMKGVYCYSGPATYSCIFDFGFAAMDGTITTSGCIFYCEDFEFFFTSSAGTTVQGSFYSVRTGKHEVVDASLGAARTDLLRITKVNGAAWPYSSGSCDIGTDGNGEMYLVPSAVGAAATNRVTLPTGKRMNFIDTTAAGNAGAVLGNAVNNAANTGWFPIEVNNATAYVPYWT